MDSTNHHPAADPAPPPAAKAPPRRKSYAWAWFFVFIAVASVGLSVFMVQFNLRLQLKPEQLEAAWQRWKERGPRDYLMIYTKRLTTESRTEQFIVRVRGGKVQEVLMDGMPLEPAQLPYHSMDRLFADVERFLDLDHKPGQPKTYTIAVFDEETGALRKYIRNVPGTKERLELNVELKDLPGDR